MQCVIQHRFHQWKDNWYWWAFWKNVTHGILPLSSSSAPTGNQSYARNPDDMLDNESDSSHWYIPFQINLPAVIAFYPDRSRRLRIISLSPRAQVSWPPSTAFGNCRCILLTIHCRRKTLDEIKPFNGPCGWKEVQCIDSLRATSLMDSEEIDVMKILPNSIWR